MITVFRWDPTTKKGEWLSADALPATGADPKDATVWWVDLNDPTPEEEERVYKQFLPVHPLSVEDVTRPRREPGAPPHLPKVEEFSDYLFVIVNPAFVEPSPRPATEGGALAPRVPPRLAERVGHPQDPGLSKARPVQLSAVLTHTVLITHHYEPLTSVEELRSFLTKHGHSGGRGPDYLFHVVLDAIVDEYAPLLDRVTDALEDLEARVFREPTPALIADLLAVKRQVIGLRKMLILEREVLARLSRNEFELIDERESVYYRNVYDHLVRYTELIEGARETVSDLMQSHLAAMSNRLNEVMKVLAMISTTVLPMTLIAGVFGMNFNLFLDQDLGFLFAVGLMVLSGVGSVLLFRWMKWL